ncbi:acyltransferase 3 [Acidisarcina polymorpha]|uniref:Acyltransferase 3 n=1 Tax=Acidisarcina polymorpha TaxID=2211140 RepID=A0A2Z5FYT5_9BACT|nr:acyltransferase [Acidisarcina polymorpha]AXC11536.1 acyltransferase 3 [Acidisarcina polymorpha]
MPKSIPVTANTERTKPENRAFFPALDGLRAIAFLMVFFHHYLLVPWGWMGVDVFFVLSGFLITGILYDTCHDAYRARNFYVRRTLRIFPLYYSVMLALLLSAPIFHWQWSWSWLIWPAYLGNYAPFLRPYLPLSPMERLADFHMVGAVSGFHITLFLGHFWSLCVEEQFYLIWPWVVFWIRDRVRLCWICAATLPLCLAMRLAGQHLFPKWMLDNQILSRATPFRLDALLIGGLIALLLRGSYSAMLLRIARVALPIAMAILLAWAYFTPAGNLVQQAQPDADWLFTWWLSALDLLAALVILVAVQPRSLLYRGLSLRPLRWLGRISYGAYVLHDIPHVFYSHIGIRLAPTHPRIAVATVALISSIGLAWLSFRYLESPFLNLKERFTVSSTPVLAQRSERT